MSGALERLRSGARATGIGLISGTSADGIDAAAVDLWEEEGRLRTQVRGAATLPYPDSVREQLFRAFDDALTVSQLCSLNAVLGGLFAEAAERAVEVAGLVPGDLAFVASHGQTVWHQPVEDPERGLVRGTLQLGEAAIIAERLGVPVVSDFRQQDLALGGQGAPLVPYVDHLLFADAGESRAVQNIGGIGNVTYLRAGASRDELLAFDTGPGNALIDAAAARCSDGTLTCDRDGRLAASAPVDAALLGHLLAEPYFSQPPPKSTGRELFSARMVDVLWKKDFPGPVLVSTLTQLTVESIARAYRKWLGPVDTVIVGGGGSRNPELMRRLQAALPGAKVSRHEDFGIDGDAKEALAFAVLGYETLRGRPSNLPSATGAAHPAILGKITHP
jgi:anhydro-N-acetylmuramic acid kinase